MFPHWCPPNTGGRFLALSNGPATGEVNPSRILSPEPAYGRFTSRRSARVSRTLRLGKYAYVSSLSPSDQRAQVRHAATILSQGHMGGKFVFALLPYVQH